MSAPFYATGAFGDEAALVVAFVIGLGFGFFLERAGFGSATKLVSQFYLDDLAVFKVMFTAIVTAMLGVAGLAGLGWLDTSAIYLVPTVLWPQIVGGLVLGAGFVVGGYCPGTSVAGIATGKLDALVYALGIGAGTVVFAEVFPRLEAFYESGSYGELTLPEVFRLPVPAVVLGVVLLSLAGFRLAERIEARFRSQGEGAMSRSFGKHVQ